MTAFENRQTLAGVWDLQPSDSVHAPESAFNLDMRNESAESVVGPGDERLLVEERHFSPGGKYRSIVKLFIHYEFQPAGQYAMGTGWLVRPDVLVTAGHCTGATSLDVQQIKAYIGYKGTTSVKDPNVQFRTAKRVVTTEGWLKARGAKNFDVGFVQVNKPFTGIKPITFIETPPSGNFSLGVVGYPGDLEDKRTREKGALMYEMFLPTEFDLASQTDTMLEYQIDTFGGNSGSPVLRESDLVSLGAHVYGGTFNSASVIGRFGNPYNDYLTAFSLDASKVKAGVNLIPVTNTAGGAACPNCQAQMKCPNCNQATSVPILGPAFSPKGPYPNGSKAINSNASQPRRLPGSRMGQTKDEEGLFLDIMKGAASVVGPFGGPLGVLASVAINAASTLAESTNAESTLDPSMLHEGTVERAILADAALTAVQQMNLHPEEEEGIFSDMKDFIVKAAPTVRRIAPKILGAMMEPALRMAMDSLHDYNQKNQGGVRGAEGLFDAPAAPVLPHITYSTQIDMRGDRKTEDFVNGLQNALEAGQESYDAESEEGFFGIIKAGCRLAGKGLSFAVNTGLPLLAQHLGGAESLDAESFEADKPAATSGPASSDALAKRAIAGEAALQALMKLEPHRLEEEGFFDFIGNAVRTIAPTVLKFAPAVISNISPTIGGIIKAATGQEASFVSNGRRQQSTRPTVGKKPSTMRLRRDEGSNNGSSDFLAKLQARN